LPLALYAKDSLYKSMRPKTDMDIFRQATSLSYKPKRKINDYEYILDEKLIAVPVTRYASGMSKGLYYDDESTNQDFCGTYYYYEPESTTFLVYTVSATYRNKYSAMFACDEDHKYTDFTNSTVERCFKHPEEFPEDLRMTPREYYEFLEINDPEEFPDWDKIGNDKYYVGKVLNLYAVEDMYDQELCKCMHKKGKDVVILTHMIGSRQIVAEVLDTRERSESFSNLCYPKSK
jgi:hypothetical protein